MENILTLQQAIGLGSALIIVLLGLLLLAIRIPYAKEWDQFRRLRIYLAIAFFILGSAGFFITFFIESEPNNMFPALGRVITLVVGSLQALFFAITCLAFIRSSYVSKRNVFYNGAVIVAVGVVLFVALEYLPKLFTPLFYIAMGLYACQLACYLFLYRQEHWLCVEYMEEYYADDMEGRMRYIRNLFYSALLVGTLALLSVAVPISYTVFNVFIVLYTLYYVYVVSAVYSYRTEALFLVKAISEEDIAKKYVITDDDETEELEK